jgi:glycosyltransferase involved in cell wall biosynthesis
MKSCDRVSDSENKKVCMCVFNNFTHDSRVLKEALSLYKIGYSVTVVARLDDNTSPIENIDGIRVKRISTNPVHLKLINLIRRLTRWDIPLVKHEARIRELTRWDVLANKMSGCAEYASEESYSSAERSTRIRLTPRELVYQGVRRTLRSASSILNQIARSARVSLRRGIVDPMVSFLIKFHRPLLILDFNYRTLKAAAVEKYDVFHAHDLNTLIGAYLAARKQDANLIYDSHELYLERNRFAPYKPIGKWIRKKVEAYLISRSDHVITVNDSLARVLADTYKVKLPTVIMNIPSLRKTLPPSQHISLRHEIGIEDNYHILLYSGSITFNRGLENLIQALVYLPQCFLVLMGYSQDKYADKLRTIAVEKGVAPRLGFFGPVPSDQVTLYAAGADLGVAPIENVCLSYYYCSPNKLFEYLLAGLPVIASAFPEMSHIIDKYGVGGTFDPSMPKDIARVATEILEAPEKWKNIRERTDALAVTFNWENESRKLIDIYQSLR